MSENRSRDLSEYDSMSTEALEQILRSDAEAPAGEESDTEVLLYVMGVLAERRKNSNNPGITAQEAYESFKQHYLPEDIQTDEPCEREVGSKPGPLRFLRSLTAAAAAVLVLVFLGTFTANAFGFDIWKPIVKWTKEAFYFVRPNPDETTAPGIDTDSPFAELRDALAAYNCDPSIVPTWLPEGYEFTMVNVSEDPTRRTVVACYQNYEKIIKISARLCINSDPEQIERSDGFVEIYEAAGIDYYIFEDNRQVRAAWITGSCECYISGELTIKELKMMIDSIEKG